MEELKPEQVRSETTPLVEWVAHPAKQRPVAAVLVAVFIAVIAVGIYSWTYSIVFTVLGAAVLTASLAGFYFPTRYSFYEDTVVAKYTVTTIKKEWSQFRSFYKDKNGVLLSPFPNPSRLENFRGLFLRYGDCDRGEVIEFVRAKIEKGNDGH